MGWYSSYIGSSTAAKDFGASIGASNGSALAERLGPPPPPPAAPPTVAPPRAVLNPKAQDHDLAKNISSLVIGSGDDAFAIVDAVMGDQAELVLPRENPLFLTQSALFAFSPGSPRFY